MRCSRFLMLLIFLVLGIGSISSAPPDKQDKSKNNRKGNETGQAQYYKKWLNEDASYIITSDEKSVFKNLKNDEERESFIEQFWTRRNPDPRSPDNSFKEEHYRRIAYANEHFASGIPGWKSDRGRIYVMYGKPDQIESHPTGGSYDRPYYEGGGRTSTFPFEKWWYRHIDGIGDGIELEFVDSSISNEYRLAMSPDEKDALLYVPNAGLKSNEEAGYVQKKERSVFDATKIDKWNSVENSYQRSQDSFASRMEQYFILQRPPKIKFDDLRISVTSHIIYDTLPYEVKTDYIKLSSDKVLVPITIELNNSELEFRREQDFNRAKVNVYGMVTSLTGKIAAEWEDEISKVFNDLYFFQGKNKPSEYQRIIALPPGQRYKLDLVLKDVNSKKMGSISIGLNVPKYEDTELQSSTIILAENITQAPANAKQLDQFVIGDMRIVPKVKAEYVANQNLVPYMQIYNMQIDQASQKPSLDVTFAVKKNGKMVEELKDTAINSEQIFYGQRVALVGKIPLKSIAPGKYTLEIKVEDNISNRSVTTSTEFRVQEATPAIPAISSAAP
jgi:GWxTD domain-containing protein